MKHLTYKHIILAAKIYLLAVGVFTIFRLILFFTGLSYITTADSFDNVLYAFFMGLRFDVVITGYIAFFPFIALTVIALINLRSKWPVKLIFYLLFVIFSLSFMVCAIDIPYFGQFFTRLNVGAFQWMNTPGFVLKMIVQEFSYIVYIIPLVLLIVFFFFGLKKAFSTYMRPSRTENIWLSVFLSLCTAGLMFIGIRGRVEEKSPIVVGTAFFGSNAFLNQLGLNPNFTLMRSWLDKNKGNENIHFMGNEEALRQVQNFFAIQSPDECSPILRHVRSDSLNTIPANVVLILMESMCADRMQHFGNQQQLTPFLDSIAASGYLFENIYSAGIHTHNGIFSTLFSFPALYSQCPMLDVSMPKYNGMASALKKHGYSTMYFTTHDGQFDNIEGFLLGNDFDAVITKNNYPSKRIVNTLGVPDDYMFEYAMPILAKRYKEQAPFFAVFMTASNHTPYHIPEYFSPRQANIKDKMVEYADWSLNKFMAMAAQQEWFSNTLFIFIADHGAIVDAIYDMPLSYNHVPLIMYAPEIIPQAKIWNCLGGQIDVFPTAMHLLRLPYMNNTMGINLLSEQRPFMYFAADDKYGVVSDSLFLIVAQNNGSEGLFRYRHGEKTNYIDQFETLAKEMKDYAKANMQVTQYIIAQRKQGCGL